jgi:hypothetical protein
MVKKFSKGLLIAIVGTLLISFSAMAATWEYKFPVEATDTSNVTRTNYPIVTGLAGQSFIDSGKINANGLDTNMQVTTTSIKYLMSTDEVTAVIPTLPSGGSVSLGLYTGYLPEQTLFSIIPGYGGYGTIVDAVPIELGDNFTLNYNSAWFNTDNGTDKNLLRKNEAIKVYVSETVSGNITADIYSVTATDETLRPSGAGSETNIVQVSGFATHWEAVRDSNDLTYVLTNNAAYERDLYTTANSAVPVANRGVINSVTIYFRIGSPGVATTTAGKPALKTHSVVYDGTEQSYGTEGGGSYSTKSQVYNTNPNTSAAWTWDEIDDLESGVSIKRTAGASNAACTEVYITVNYNHLVIDASATVTGVSSGEHDLTVSANTTHLILTIDGTSNSTLLSGASVPDNGNDITIMENNSVVYADNMTVEINGVRTAWYEPNSMLSGAIVPDRSGGDNPMTLTWGSNSDVSIHYGAMVSSEYTEATETAPGGFELPTTSMPSHWFNTAADLSGLPFYDHFNQVATEAGQPVAMYYFWIAMGMAWVIFITLVLYTRSALFGMIGMILVLTVFSMQGVVAGWIVFAIAIIDMFIAFLYHKVTSSA